MEERFKRKDGASNPFENDLNRSAGLNGNCTTPSYCEFVKSVLGCTIRLMNSRARSRKQNDQNSVATLNMYDNWFGMLQDDEPPKASRRPRKSTKS